MLGICCAEAPDAMPRTKIADAKSRLMFIFLILIKVNTSNIDKKYRKTIKYDKKYQPCHFSLIFAQMNETMKRIFFFTAVLLSLTSPGYAQTRRERLKEHVYYFASDSLQGRKAGSEFATKASEYIIKEYERAGLAPFFAEGWYDRFRRDGKDFKNVVGVIQGTDLKDEYIVLGAHYDHLGVKGGEVYNGADDNASGSAAVIEIARALQGQQLRRSVIIAAFDAEELGLYGSNHLAARLDSMDVDVKLMMSIDMVGWLSTGKTLKLEGVSTIRDGKELVTRGAARNSIMIDMKNFERSVLTATDTEGFARNGIPTLAVSTGLKSPYHKPGDDPQLIDYDGLDKVTGYLVDLTGEVAGSGDFAASGRVAPKHRTLSDVGVDFGIVGGLGSSRMDFPDAAFNGKSGFAWSGGAEIHMSFAWLGIQASALYDRFNCRFPDVNDVFGSSLKYRQQGYVCPVNVLLQSRRSSAGGGYFGAGAYYELVDSCSLPGYDLSSAGNQWGISWTIGSRVGKLGIAVLCLDQVGSLFKGEGQPKVKRTSVQCQIKYYF